MKPLFLRFFLLSFLLTGESFAQWRREVLFDVSTQVSQDSQVRVESKTPVSAEVKWIWVSVSKGSKKIESIFENAGGEFENTIWLRYGPGQYKVQIMTSKATERYNGNYYVDSVFTIENTDTRENIDFLAPTTDIQSDAKEIVDLSETIVHGLSSDMEKTSAIHNWVASNIAYDIESFMDGSYVRKRGDALKILEIKKGVCQGYAHLTAALNRAAGIPAKLITGEAIRRGEKWTGRTNHAWNEMLVDGKWIIQDTTWDAGYIDFRTKTFTFKLQQKYFNPDPVIFAEDHRAEVLP